MTEQQRITFIKNKLAPLFDGMNAEDVLAILDQSYDLKRAIFSRFTIFLKSRKT